MLGKNRSIEKLRYLQSLLSVSQLTPGALDSRC